MPMPSKKHQLKLIAHPAEVLTMPAKEVAFPLPADFQRVVDELIRVCRKHKGLGLAAPQVGLSMQVAVINLEEYDMPAFPLINPEITKFSSKKVKAEEGCLSIPGVYAMVERPEKIDVKTYSYEGKLLEFKADGMLARVIQHEVDHLHGILFIDHLPEDERSELMRNYKSKSISV
jgi:peptide deformylase